MRIDVVDNPALRRFGAFADGELAGFIAYSIRNDQHSDPHREPDSLDLVPAEQRARFGLPPVTDSP